MEEKTMIPINQKQHQLYEGYDVSGAHYQYEAYKDILDKYCACEKTVKILDIGGELVRLYTSAK